VSSRAIFERMRQRREIRGGHDKMNAYTARKPITCRVIIGESHACERSAVRVQVLVFLTMFANLAGCVPPISVPAPVVMSRSAGLEADLCALAMTSREIAGTEYEIDLGQAPGTSVAVLVRSDSLFLLGPATPSGGLSAFTDNAGSNLISASRPPVRASTSEYGVWLSRHAPFAPGYGYLLRHDLLLLYNAPGLPASGASSLHLDGALRVLVGGPPDSLRIADIAPQIGKIGPPADSIEITNVGTPTLDSPTNVNPYAIRVRITGPFAERVAGVGIEVPGENSPESLRKAGARYDEIDIQFRISGKPSAFALKLDLLKYVSEVTVPISFTFGMGFRGVCTSPAAP
jgi:hypothetical protein